MAASSVSSEPWQSRGGGGGAGTAREPIAPGASHTRNSCASDLRPGTPQEWVGRPETRGLLPAGKAGPEGRSRIIRRPWPVCPQRLRGSLESRGGCDDPRLLVHFI
ncbi:hypothetical protein NDU88_003640 [Pleurodeles waltl]|uniref:Uncharacterized protein n=1 Tax=Pleurodeles waltl TaxID=8319 RepID=A0AAV7MSF5_PLEWA|nr:hypothetical protein NDU88_003640 [Pleurodeles waltl]